MAAGESSGARASIAAPASRGSRSRESDPQRRIGLALAGGGFLGAAYELGALAAIGEAIDGLDLCALDTYVGVSAGSYIAAGLANGLSPQQMVRMFVEAEDAEGPFDPTTLLSPAYKEWWARLRLAPGTLLSAIAGALREGRWPPHALVWRALERASVLLPIGLIDSAPAQRNLSRQLAQAGQGDDFRRLNARLRIVATDIDSGESVAFGDPGYEHVPISRAVAASSAVPGLFAPVEIDGRYFVDGALNKTMHASVALREGAGLVLCVNPLVPFAGASDGSAGQPVRASLPSLLSQSIRTVIRSRMTVGLEKYGSTHPGATVLLFEPSRDDAQTFLTSIFDLSSRRRLCEHAYQHTRDDLRRRAPELDRRLRPFGLALNARVLADRGLTLVRPLARPSLRPSDRLGKVVERLEQVLDDVERAVRLGTAG